MNKDKLIKKLMLLQYFYRIFRLTARLWRCSEIMVGFVFFVGEVWERQNST